MTAGAASGDGGGTGPPPARGPAELRQEDFDELVLPIAAVDLERMLVVAAAPGVLSLGGLLAADIIGRPVSEITAPSDRKSTELALEVLAKGGVDFFRSPFRFSALGENDWFTTWAVAEEICGRRVALVQLAAGAPPQASPLASYLGSELVELSFGTVDRSYLVTRASTGVQRFLAAPPEDVVGRPLLGVIEHGDVDRLLGATVATRPDFSVGLSLQVRTGQGGWSTIRTVFGPLADSPERFFILLPEPQGTNLRERKLMHHLQRVAAEVQASGILEVAPTVPALAHLAGRGGLTPRQWEVLTRLLRGERVAMIARELFVSESTVRNHLSVIYDRMGVGSQAELIALALGQHHA